LPLNASKPKNSLSGVNSSGCWTEEVLALGDFIDDFVEDFTGDMGKMQAFFNKMIN
jgi:hypothetical protein